MKFANSGGATLRIPHPWHRCGAKPKRGDVTAAVRAMAMLPAIASGHHEMAMLPNTVSDCRQRHTAEARRTAPAAIGVTTLVVAQDRGVATGSLAIGQDAVMDQDAALGLV